MKKLIVFMVLAVAAGTYTTSFAADSESNKLQKEIIRTNQESTEQLLSKSSDHKHHKKEESALTILNEDSEDEADSRFMLFGWIPVRITHLLIKLSIVFSLIGLVILFQYLIPRKHAHNHN